MSNMSSRKPSPKKTCPLGFEVARKQARLLRALADPYRLQIVAMLQRYNAGALTVTDIVEGLASIEQSTVSHHLRVLRDAGLIDYTKEGLYVRYRIQMGSVIEAYGAIYQVRERHSTVIPVTMLAEVEREEKSA